ncbi:Crp/Fnr family transcriptional regulator [Streptomyces sp. MMG1533]|uniref:Crp/Fnr family transcriptional regulator n=1 Tax=Streptomyces sp. MMG1533 TaxID=1415546 RepID=UPI0006AEADFF|nr:Crp/Fnr family transcriptional regulator [Streptomyces sp. MMG1533]KOU61113.1 Crp/Fnr family transcriptional regulator [Streptomyces sp. MMG1533]
MALLERSQPFLPALKSAECESLMGLGGRQVFPPGDHLFQEGERGTHVLIVLRGWGVVSTATQRGTAKLTLGLRGPGELLGEMAALDSRPRSATVTALGAVETLLVPGDRFRRFLIENPHAGGLVMSQLSSRLRSADGERRSLASLTVLQRLSARLLELAEGSPSASGSSARPGVSLAQEDLAAAVGATREAVAKALGLLRNQKIVRTGTRRVEILDTELLRLLAGGHAAPPGGLPEGQDG